MNVEHARRKLECKRESDLRDFENAMSEYEDTIHMLKQELMRTHAIQAAQRNIIEQLHTTLTNNGLPVKHSMTLLTNCKAKN